jgi:hypothetical protein
MTILDEQLHHETGAQNGATGETSSNDSDTGVRVASAGIAEVLRMRVGCWLPPVHFSMVPTAA